MPKPRTKRSEVREERKRKRRQEQDERRGFPKRPRKSPNDDPSAAALQAEKEFFGLLADEEQEYFRRADEMLELNQFPSAEERDLFIDSVWREAQGKELKLASSQSCSRLMERLIQLSGPAHKKRLFEAFAGHFPSLVQHRFASHCCEALFLRSAGVVTRELAGFDPFVVDTAGRAAGDAQAPDPEASMESLFLATLDELEGSLSFLVTDRFASHALRVLLLVLSGRPLDEAAARTLVRSRKKEQVSVAGAAAADEQNQGLRAVPASFALAVAKIIADTTAKLDATGLRVLAKHPIGNPTLQLLLELDLTLDKADGSKPESTPAQSSSLLYRLLPGAPQSLADESSEAAEFVNGMMYDPIGSRLVETIIAHCPGKVFKALNHNIFLPRIHGYVRNDVSSYPAIRVLNRLGKDDLAEAVAKIAPTVPQLVSRSRFNVLKVLFVRCAVRGALDQVKQLMKGLREGCADGPADLVITLCCLRDPEEDKDKVKGARDAEQAKRNRYAVQSHGAQLLAVLCSVPGPSKGVQEAILALPSELLLRLAKTSMPTVSLLRCALAAPSANASFQKSLVNAVAPHAADLAQSQFGHNLVNAIAAVPCKGKELSVPYHVKEAVMQGLGAREPELRESWMGRSVWRTWKGDMWKTRPGDWKAWMRELDAATFKEQLRLQQDSGELGDAEGGQKAKRKRDKKDKAAVEKGREVAAAAAAAELEEGGEKAEAEGNKEQKKKKKKRDGESAEEEQAASAEAAEELEEEKTAKDESKKEAKTKKKEEKRQKSSDVK